MEPQSTFPDDANGDVLRRLQSHGDDLSRSRDIDFTVIFPDEQAARGFAEILKNDGYRVTVEMTECNKELPWDALVVRHMVPTHEGIGSFENELETVASRFGGRNDGWGCISQTEN
jgi:hypothetical protein